MRRALLAGLTSGLLVACQDAPTPAPVPAPVLPSVTSSCGPEGLHMSATDAEGTATAVVLTPECPGPGSPTPRATQVAHASRASRAPQPVRRTPVPTRAARSRPDSLPAVLLRIRWCESRDDYRAENPTSTASGAFQVIDGTWGGYGGYSHASHAPRAVQDAFALRLYRQRGTQPWNASRKCWAR